MPKIEILLPVGERAGSQESRVSPRLDSLKGMRIGVLSNNWKAMEYIADECCARLVADFGAKEAFAVSTPSTLAMPRELVDDIAARCDAVIVGLAT
jgi:hypothetical protein